MNDSELSQATLTELEAERDRIARTLADAREHAHHAAVSLRQYEAAVSVWQKRSGRMKAELDKVARLIADKAEHQRQIDSMIYLLTSRAGGRDRALLDLVDAVKQHHNDPHSDTVAWSIIEQVEAYARRYHAIRQDAEALERMAGEYIPGRWDNDHLHYRLKCEAVARMIDRWGDE